MMKLKTRFTGSLKRTRSNCLIGDPFVPWSNWTFDRCSLSFLFLNAFAQCVMKLKECTNAVMKFVKQSMNKKMTIRARQQKKLQCESQTNWKLEDHRSLPKQLLVKHIAYRLGKAKNTIQVTIKNHDIAEGTEEEAQRRDDTTIIDVSCPVSTIHRLFRIPPKN